MTEISVSPEVLRQKFNEIAELDEQIAQASGSDSAGKRAISNALASEHSATWKPVADQVSEFFSGLTVEVQAGALSGLISALNETFREEIDKFLSAQVEANKTDTVQVSDEELTALLEKRKEFNDEYKALRNILEMFGQDVSDIPVPKKMTGSRGPRGPRTLSKFDYSIDGEPRTESQNSLSSIANTVCKDMEIDGQKVSWKTKDLREFLVSQGLDIENPADSWSYTLPNGKVLSAVKSAETDQYEVNDGDDDDVTPDVDED